MNNILAANAAWGKKAFHLGLPQPPNLSSAIAYIRAKADTLGLIGLRFNRTQRRAINFDLVKYLTMTAKISRMTQKMQRKFNWLEELKAGRPTPEPS